MIPNHDLIVKDLRTCRNYLFVLSRLETSESAENPVQNKYLCNQETNMFQQVREIFN